MTDEPSKMVDRKTIDSSPSAADLPCIGQQVPDVEEGNSMTSLLGDTEKTESVSHSLSNTTLGELAALRRRRTAGVKIPSSPAAEEHDDLEVCVMSTESLPKLKGLGVEFDAPDLVEEAATQQNKTPVDKEVTPIVGPFANEEKFTLESNLERIGEQNEVRPAIVLSGSSVYLRLERRDYLKVRSCQPFFSIGAEKNMNSGVENGSECFYRIKAKEEQTTIGFDTRNHNKHWIPIPLCLYGGCVLVDKATEVVFLSSRSTTCKMQVHESRSYPTRGTVKFEVDNFDPTERLLATLISDTQDTPYEGSPSVGIPADMYAAALNVILANPNHRLNQIGGGVILVAAPINTVRLRLDVDDEIEVDTVSVVAWTQGIRFIFKTEWWFRSVFTSIKGPGTVWFSAKMSPPPGVTRPYL